MINFVCYLVPGVIATQLLIALGIKLTTKEYIVHAGIFNFIILLLNYLILCLAFDDSNIIIPIHNSITAFVVKYMLMSVAWAFVLPFVRVKLISRLQLGLSVESE